MVADTAADMEMHLVADKEVNKVADVVSDEKKEGYLARRRKKVTQFGERGMQGRRRRMGS